MGGKFKRSPLAQSVGLNNQTKNVTRFWVICKLYVVMGGTWFFEMTGFLLSWRYRYRILNLAGIFSNILTSAKGPSIKYVRT